MLQSFKYSVTQPPTPAAISLNPLADRYAGECKISVLKYLTINCGEESRKSTTSH